MTSSLVSLSMVASPYANLRIEPKIPCLPGPLLFVSFSERVSLKDPRSSNGGTYRRTAA
jgi:hypothetical protein